MTAITFYSNDTSVLHKFLDLALKLNVRVNIQPLTDESFSKETFLDMLNPSEETRKFYSDTIDAIKWSNAEARGENIDTDLQSVEEFLNELHEIANETIQNDHQTLATV